MSIIDAVQDAQIEAAENLICKNLNRLEIATDAVQRGGSLIRDKLLKENHELKELITLFHQNLGTVDFYLKQGKFTRAKSEINRFNAELDIIEKVMHSKYGNHKGEPENEISTDANPAVSQPTERD